MPSDMPTLAILTFDGFNEIDSLIALHLVNRARPAGLRAFLACPSDRVTSLNGVVLHAQAPLESALEADAVIVGSGTMTRDVVADTPLLARIRLDPARQLVASQCSGAMVLAKLGLLADVPACTDLRTKPWVEEAGVQVLDQPFFARGNVATAGGCLASVYLATWVMVRLAGEDAAREALRYVTPVGEREVASDHAIDVVRAYL